MTGARAKAIAGAAAPAIKPALTAMGKIAR
jgi:hypothetical protein